MHQSVEEANVVPIGRLVGTLGAAGTKSEGARRGRDWKKPKKLPCARLAH